MSSKFPRGREIFRLRNAVLLAALPLLLLGVGACSRGRRTAVETGNREQVLHLGNGAEPTDLDPQIVTGTKEFNITQALFEGLAGVDGKTLKAVPGVAQSWDKSADGRVYTFHLRPEAKWSNGERLTAGDFVYSYQRVLSPNLASEFAYYLWIIKNARPFNKGDLKDSKEVGVKAINDSTLEVTLENPTPYFVDVLYAAPFMPVHRATIEAAGPMDRRGTRWTRPENFVGNGPFMLKEWKVNEVVVAAKNPHYWDAGAVRLKEVRFYPTENIDTEERSFRAGQLHKTYAVPFSKIDSYRRDPAGLLRLDPYSRTQYLALNCARPGLDNVKVRRALGLAIDREAIVRTITRGGERAAYSFISPGMNGYYSHASLPYDPNAARALLAEAGYPQGKGLPPVELLFNTSDANRVVAEAVQQMWNKELGVQCKLANQEWKVYLDARKQKNYQIYEGGWTGSYLDPTAFLELFVGGSIINQTNWANSAYDSALLAASREGRADARLGILDGAETTLMNEAPIIPLYHHNRAYLLSPAVQNWNSNLLDNHAYKYVWLKE